MQYYLELNPPVPDVYFESSAFSKASEQLDTIAKRIGLPSHFELFSFAAQNDLSPPEHQETEVPWFDAKVGIDWLDKVVQHIRTEPSAVPQAERLVADFAECRAALVRAAAAGSKWHFAMDI
jgi:hypothetical protein